MLVHIILTFCTQAVLIQSVLSQCVEQTVTGPRVDRISALSLRAAPAPTISPSKPISCEYSSAFATEAVPITTGTLPVTSVSAIPLESIAVSSENSYEGSLTVSGELPFLGTVSLDGELPTAGKGAVKHACGGPARLTKVNLPSTSTNTRINSAAAFDNGFNGIRNPIAGEYPEICNEVASAVSPGRIGYIGTLGNGGAMKIGPYDLPGVGYVGLKALENSGAVRQGYNVARDGHRRTGLGNALKGFGDYTATGEGNVVVAGQLPVAGETVLIGQVPITGAVVFKGRVPSFGTVSIKAFRACGCDAPY